MEVNPPGILRRTKRQRTEPPHFANYSKTFPYHQNDGEKSRSRSKSPKKSDQSKKSKESPESIKEEASPKHKKESTPMQKVEAMPKTADEDLPDVSKIKVELELVQEVVVEKTLDYNPSNNVVYTKGETGSKSEAPEAKRTKVDSRRDEKDTKVDSKEDEIIEERRESSNQKEEDIKQTKKKKLQKKPVKESEKHTLKDEICREWDRSRSIFEPGKMESKSMTAEGDKNKVNITKETDKRILENRDLPLISLTSPQKVSECHDEIEIEVNRMMEDSRPMKETDKDISNQHESEPKSKLPRILLAPMGEKHSKPNLELTSRSSPQPLKLVPLLQNPNEVDRFQPKNAVKYIQPMSLPQPGAMKKSFLKVEPGTLQLNDTSTDHGTNKTPVFILMPKYDKPPELAPEAAISFESDKCSKTGLHKYAMLKGSNWELKTGFTIKMILVPSQPVKAGQLRIYLQYENDKTSPVMTCEHHRNDKSKDPIGEWLIRVMQGGVRYIQKDRIYMVEFELKKPLNARERLEIPLMFNCMTSCGPGHLKRFRLWNIVVEGVMTATAKVKAVAEIRRLKRSRLSDDYPNGSPSPSSMGISTMSDEDLLAQKREVMEIRRRANSEYRTLMNQLIVAEQRLRDIDEREREIDNRILIVLGKEEKIGIGEKS